MTVYRVLVVDDEPAIRSALTRMLRSRGYDVADAADGNAALAELSAGQFELMLCDVKMPGINGIDLIPQALAADPDLGIVMLTSANDAPTATTALSRGALNYLVKPFEIEGLHQSIEQALRKRGLLLEQRRVERLIREEVAQRTMELEHMSVAIVETLVQVAELKDPFFRGHSQRVSELAAAIATEMKLSVQTVANVRLAGQLQDVGRIGVRESVLNKTGSLTDEELQHIRDHLPIGVRILTPLTHLGVVLTYVQDHHEHWYGGGYPRGLKGGAISIGGRILAGADAFSALTSKRAYREPLAAPRALEYMETLVGALLDPKVYAALRSVVARA